MFKYESVKIKLDLTLRVTRSMINESLRLHDKHVCVCTA